MCFTVEEATAIGDTLWSRLDDREKRRLAQVIIGRLNEQAASFQRENDILLGQMRPLAASEAEAREGERLAREEAGRWRLKARGRGGRGFLIGIPLGGLATYGGLRLFGAIR